MCVTPFRVVAQDLRARLQDKDLLFARFGIDDARHRIMDRIGTIHTSQSEEADAVIEVLGAPGWASGTPNVLNVMVSRAKARLYVLDSRTVLV